MQNVWELAALYVQHSLCTFPTSQPCTDCSVDWLSRIVYLQLPTMKIPCQKIYPAPNMISHLYLHINAMCMQTLTWWLCKLTWLPYAISSFVTNGMPYGYYLCLWQRGLSSWSICSWLLTLSCTNPKTILVFQHVARHNIIICDSLYHVVWPLLLLQLNWCCIMSMLILNIINQKLVNRTASIYYTVCIGEIAHYTSNI